MGLLLLGHNHTQTEQNREICYLSHIGGMAIRNTMDCGSAKICPVKILPSKNTHYTVRKELSTHCFLHMNAYDIDEQQAGQIDI